jgi:hypothetical protein
MKGSFVFVISAIAALFISCNSVTSGEVEKGKEKIKPTELKSVVYGKKFFIYDELVHYSINISEKEIMELIENRIKTDSLKSELLEGITPANINDTSFIKKLEQIGYKKNNIAKDKFVSIDSIFVEKTVTESWTTKCVVVYRNILLFKRQNKTIGIAKICFGCGKNRIVGTTANTENFGFDGDYRKLESILKN